MTSQLKKDPLNLIISGVAGQGNVLIAMLIGNSLVNDGYQVMFGQTFGSNQRGGSVRNYIRISGETKYSPIIPRGHGDIILGMEPIETMRMLREYGNPDVMTVVNPRAIMSIDSRGGTVEYPDINKLLEDIRKLSARTWIINATEEAQKMGNLILANVILAGGLIGTGILPLKKESFEALLQERFPRALEINMQALNRGIELTTEQPGT